MLEALKFSLAKKMINFTEYWRIREIRSFPGIHPTANVCEGVVIKKDVKIGKKSYINGPGTLVDSGTLGAYCSIADHVVIGPGEHPIDTVTTHLEWPLIVNGKGWENTKPAPIIGNDVWLGTGVTVLRGAVIEDGAIIGAGAVVRDCIPAYAIAVGIPAKVIRYRFDDETRAAMWNSKWWEWDEAKIKEGYNHFHDVKEFLEFANSGRITPTSNIP